MTDRARATSPASSTAPRVRIDLTMTVLVGLGVFAIAMTAYAVVVFRQFTVVQVLAVALCFFALLVGLAAWLTPQVRRARPVPTILSFIAGLVLAVVLFVLAFTWVTTPGPIWTEYFPSFPLVQLAKGTGFHQDAVFHVSLIQSILNFGYPSTAQNGVPFVPYHVLSHYADALILWLTGLQPYDSYGMFFHFKVTIFLAAIVIFLWTISRRLGFVAFVLTLLFLAPVLLSTWIGVGSHALWLTSLILILSARYVFDVIRNPRPRLTQFGAVFLIGVSVGLGKVSSGLMFVVLVGAVLLLKSPRRRLPYLLIASWLVFFGIYWRLFNTGHSSGLQRPSPTGTLSFLNFFSTYGGNPIEWNLAGIYLLIALCGIFALVYRRSLTTIFLIASVVSVGALTVVTQVLAGLTQPDVFYFIFGLFVPMLLLGVQLLLRDLPRPVRFPGSVAGLPARAVRFALVALMLIATAPLYKSPVNVFTLATPAIAESLIAADSGYFSAYNQGLSPSRQVTVTGLISGQVSLEVGEDAGGSAAAFRESLKQFMNSHELTNQNTLLFVPKEVFDTDIAELGGPSWARGQLLYAVTGVPLIHAIADETIKNFGQSSYDSSALQQTLSDFDPETSCVPGKSVVTVTRWDPAEFAIACSG